MRYSYFPGCSLEGTAREYDISTRAVMRELGVELEELRDWNCCGASAADTTSHLLSLVLPARNLALAEQLNGNGQVVASCTACYVNFRKVEERVREAPELLDTINQALSVDSLVYAGKTRVCHLLDVIANDVGPQAIADRVKRPLTGLRVAPYYGCQTVRPYSPFDAPDLPESMDGILAALGTQVHPNPMRAKCCGGTLMTTKREVGLKLVSDLLQAVEGADCIATVCPMCQMNLDAYQGLVSRKLGQPVSIPILYLTQLLGLAFGLPDKQLGLNYNIVPFKSLWAKTEV
ncbi:MAG: CoB--CoM heterodisulfide reductase iron-sulfur subunit B family protein [Anaerolineae bacterium]|nr:MAG: CoB--CoM heterodisulfide reductase iron-sulfur subunit B family protein [Anaerolineae bacterium]